MTPSISAQLLRRDQLGAADRAAMFALLDRHFAGISPEAFERDLLEKSHALLLRDAAGALVGFSTMLIYVTDATGETIGVACSGDTIVDPSAWRSPALPREWIAAVRSLRPVGEASPYFWLLLAGGFRTYRLLPTFWRSFLPRYDVPDEPGAKVLLDALASERYGTRYDPATGVVRFDRPQVLRPPLAGIPPNRADDPHVKFFAEKNPAHARGDELACLCDLDSSNLTRAGRRMVYGGGA